MSLQDNMQEYLQSLVDTSQASEINSHSIMISKSPDVEDTKAVNVLKLCSHPPNGQRNADDTASTSEVVDPNNQDVIVEQPVPRRDRFPIDRQDIYETTCELSDSLSLTTEDSSEWYFPPPPCGILGIFYKKYGDQMSVFRESGYLLPFEIFCLAFTVACCFMGAYNWPLCPADVYIPRYIFFNGAIATFSICVHIMNSLWTLVLNDRIGNLRYFCAFGFGWVAIIMTLVEMTEFYTMSYSFHRSLENYCNERFYWFVHYKNITFGVVMLLTVMFYIPGRSIHYLLRGSNWIPIII